MDGADVGHDLDSNAGRAAAGARPDEPRNHGAGSTGFRLVTVLLSGALALLGARLANPLAIDDLLLMVLLFFVIPGAAVVVLGAVHRYAGVALAALFPAAWMLIASDPSDPAVLWLLPVVSVAIIVFTARRRWRGNGKCGALAGVLVLAAAVLFLPVMSSTPVAPTTLLIGIDGATWARIDPLVADGRLPRIANLLEGGQRARLRSLPSMYSPQIWSTMATGCLPAVHGIWDFGCTQSDFKVGRIWDRMRMDGRSAGVCGWYFTWPPPEEGLGPNDFVIPSTLAPDSRTHPPEYAFYWQLWAREHPRRSETVSYGVAALRGFKHGVRLSTLRKAVGEVTARRFEEREYLEQAWRDRSLSADLQADLFCELIRTRRPEFAAILMNQVDKVSHLYWKFLEPEGFPDVTEEDMARYSDAVDKLYEEIDINLIKILALVPESANVVLVSDHGFRAAHRQTAGQFCRIRTENLMEALGSSDTVFGTNVDRKVYLRPIAESFNEREETLESLRAALRGAHLTGETRSFFRVQQEGESLRLEMADRDAIPERARLVLNGKHYAVEQLITMRVEARFSGEHHPDGIFLAAGPAAAAGVRSDSLHVVDIAPTVAALLDLPFANNWRGSPALKGFLPEQVEYAEYPAPSEMAPAPERIDEALKDQLRSMGYLE
ncbi:alkaline phosphatase family protein [bacterium]|nr:alkaline phosphatase family protein [bacterium]